MVDNVGVPFFETQCRYILLLSCYYYYYY